VLPHEVGRHAEREGDEQQEQLLHERQHDEYDGDAGKRRRQAEYQAVSIHDPG
jgi:hypothetical protein